MQRELEQIRDAELLGDAEALEEIYRDRSEVGRLVVSSHDVGGSGDPDVCNLYIVGFAHVSRSDLGSVGTACQHQTRQHGTSRVPKTCGPANRMCICASNALGSASHAMSGSLACLSNCVCMIYAHSSSCLERLNFLCNQSSMLDLAPHSAWLAQNQNDMPPDAPKRPVLWGMLRGKYLHVFSFHRGLGG
jgi:hypothetical protein